MNFIGTRDGVKVTAEEAVLSGVPENGGLFVPETFPVVSPEERAEMLEMSYPERAAKILSKFFDKITADEWKEICEKSYSSFTGDDPLPLGRIDEGKYILELFHGPTCACEDVSMVLFPKLFKKCKEVTGDKSDRLFLLATSGDAGKAATEYFKNEKGFKVATFYGEESIGKMQRIALCISDGDNLLVGGVRGTFDDCKEAVEKAYASETLKVGLAEKGLKLSTISSQNIARILPEIACYFSAYLDLVSSEQIEDGDKIDFAVPAGNGCGIVAGYYAKKMGLPVRKIFSSSNRNRAFYDFFKKGSLDLNRGYRHTMSPSMDVSVPANLERFLFEALGRNAKKTATKMSEIRKDGELLTEEERKKLAQDIYAGFSGEDETVEAIYAVFEEYGYAMDTHTGVAAAVFDKYEEKREEKDDTPVVIVSVANFYKFPQESLYALDATDVKDSFKGIKRLNLLTAMKPPKFLVDFRYNLPRFKLMLSADAKKIEEEVLAFAGGKIAPNNATAKK